MWIGEELVEFEADECECGSTNLVGGFAAKSRTLYLQCEDCGHIIEEWDE